MREHTVPCRELGCRKSTWRDDAFCVQHAPSAVGAAVPLPLTGDAGEDALPARGASSPTSHPEVRP